MEARRLGATVELTIDGELGIATQAIVQGGQRLETERPIPISGGLYFDQFSSTASVVHDDAFTVRIQPTGCSDSYAVRLRGDQYDPDSRHTWLVVVGATGQYIRAREDADVEAIVNSQL